jgi:predicted nucleotidyltransferase component of viral defense system
MKKHLTDLGSSVQARLRQHSRAAGEDNQLVLLRYANERLLYRISVSPHVEFFVLKGAALFTVWTGQPHRATRDIDLLGYGAPSAEHLMKTFKSILSAAVGSDGVVYDSHSLEVMPIRATQEYGGFRLTVTAHIGTARLKLQVDVGFGDVITPDASKIEFPTLLDYPPPILLAYSQETVVSEKLEAMVSLGLANSRMKDFYDLAVLSEMFSFDGRLLIKAISATFGRRGTPLPVETPTALLPAFAQDAAKIAQWAAFVRKSFLPKPRKLLDVLDQVRVFALVPLAKAANRETQWEASWQPRGPWRL